MKNRSLMFNRLFVMIGLLGVAAGAVCVLTFTPIVHAQSYQWSVSGAHVTDLESTYMPTLITVQIDANAGSSCPAGTWLTYNGQGSNPTENVKATFALLLGAKLSGSTVELFGNNAGCVITFVHIH